MGVFDEVLLAQKRENERDERFALLLRTFDLLAREEKLLIMARLANRLEANPSSPATPAPAPIEAVDDDATLSKKALAMLRSASGGLGVGSVAMALYVRGRGSTSGLPTRSEASKARALLNYLKEQGEAYSDEHNRWFAGRPPEDASAPRPVLPTEEEREIGETALVRRVVSESPRPLDMSDIVAGVSALNPAAQKTFIYSAVYKMAKSGRFTKNPDNTYSLNRLYRPGFRRTLVAR